MHSDVHDGNLRRRRSQENHHANGVAAAALPIEGEQGLRLLISNSNRKAGGSFLQSWMTELFERIDDAIAHQVLPRIEEEEVFQGRPALFGGIGREIKVHNCFLDCTRAQRSPTVLTCWNSAA